MASSDWIRVRQGLRQHPKLIAMARSLASDAGFLAWFAQSIGVTVTMPLADRDASRDNHVTRHVTPSLDLVTRVTAASLCDVWAALNLALDADGVAPYMTIDDIDSLAGIPGFGAAMHAVEWVTCDPAGGLVFPSFDRWNNPAKSRAGASRAMTDAERAAAYRTRKKLAQGGVTAVTSRHDIEDKRREEKNTLSHSPAHGRANGSDSAATTFLSAPSDADGLAATFPPSLDMVKSAAAREGIENHIALLFFDDMEACGWIDAKQRPINPEKWVNALSAWTRRYRQNGGHRTPAGATGSTAPADPSQPTDKFAGKTDW